jgi:hypothetical protein
MDEEVKVNDKDSGRFQPEDQAAISFLIELHSKKSDPSSPIDYVRPASYSFDWLVIEKKLNRLEALGLLKIGPYIVPHTGQANSDVVQLNLTPPGMQLVRAKVTQTTTTNQTTVTRTEIEPNIPFAGRERHRNFMRTERGAAITAASVDALISDVRSHIQGIKDAPDKAKFRTHQIWLRYELLWRSHDIPEELRHEAEDCRDLAFTARRKRQP